MSAWVTEISVQHPPLLRLGDGSVMRSPDPPRVSFQIHADSLDDPLVIAAGKSMADGSFIGELLPATVADAGEVVRSDSMFPRCGCNAPVRPTFLRSFAVVECRCCGAA